MTGGGAHPDCYPATVNAEVSGKLNPSFAPSSIAQIDQKLNEEIVDAQRFRSYSGSSISPYSIGSYIGSLLKYNLQFTGGYGSPYGYYDLIVRASGHGYVINNRDVIEVNYSASSSGCFNQSDRTFQEQEINAAKSEAEAILDSIKR